METRLAVISILAEQGADVPKMNALLSEYGGWIRGRMGIPYPERNISVVSVVIDAPMECINALTGKLGMLSGITAKTLCQKL